MKIENVNNRIVTKNFFQVTKEIIAENTSPDYGLLAVREFKEKLGKEFKFLDDVYINKKSIKVSMDMDSVGKNELKRFFTKAINMIGPNYLKILLSERLNGRDLFFLEGIGVRLN